MGTQGGPEWRPAENILVDRKMPVGKFRVGAVHVGYVPHVQDDIRSGGDAAVPVSMASRTSLWLTPASPESTQYPRPHMVWENRCQGPSQKSAVLSLMHTVRFCAHIVKIIGGSI